MSVAFGPREPGSRSLWWHWIIAAAIGAILFYLLAFFIPRFALLYGYSGIKRLLYEDLGWSDAWSYFFALIGSFIYAILWLPLLQLTFNVALRRFNARRSVKALAAWLVIYGHVPLLHALLGGEVCFNQRTGAPLKWYVVEPGGQIVLYDSAGFATAGAQKLPATAQVCRILQMQKKGLRPREIRDDPRYVKFFDETTGQPRVWYSKDEKERFSLFDGEGTDPATGEILRPITKAEVREIHAQITAQQVEAERAAQLKAEKERQEAAEADRKARFDAEQREAEAKEAAHIRLVKLFGTATYSPGVTIIGAVPQQNGDLSELAARTVVNALMSYLGRKGIPSDEFRHQVYADGYFKTIFGGNTAILTEVGLRQKMRAGLLASVNTNCQPASSVLTSCSVTAEIRILSAGDATSKISVSETGAGASAAQAVSRAVELIVERHSEILNGI